MTQPQSSQPQGGLRSVYERMTKPTQSDLSAAGGLAALQRNEIERVIEHMAQAMEHLARQRPDVIVERFDNGFMVRVAPPNPLIADNHPMTGDGAGAASQAPIVMTSGGSPDADLPNRRR